MELEIQDLREKNSQVVHLLQQCKMNAAHSENEKVELMQENNELRLKLGRLRSSISGINRKYEAEFQSASEEAISFLVETSTRITRMLELYKNFVQDRRELEVEIPKWSSLSNTPLRERVNRVPPLFIDGRHIQPVVSLSRTLQTNNSRSTNSMNSNQPSRNTPQRPMPMHMLQDVFIPLTRIDAAIPNNNADEDVEDNLAEDSSDDSSIRNMDETENMLDDEDFHQRSALPTVQEESEDVGTPQRFDNPLEGPSWLLDAPNAKQNTRPSLNLTREAKDTHSNVPNATPGSSRGNTQCEMPLSVRVACEFSPTVRRRKRANSPAIAKSRSPHRQRRTSNNERILKVLVAKMRLDTEEVTNLEVTPPKKPNLDLLSPKPQKVYRRRAMESPKRQENSPMKRQENSTMEHSVEGSTMCPVREPPSKRLMRFDAPSPKGSTDSRVIVLETVNDQPEPCSSGLSKPRRVSRSNSRDTYTIRINHDHDDRNANNHNHDHIVPHSNRDNHNQHISNSIDNQIQSKNNNRLSNSNHGSCSYVNDKRSRSNRHQNHRRIDNEDNRNHTSDNQDNRNHTSDNQVNRNHTSDNQVNLNHTNDNQDNRNHTSDNQVNRNHTSDNQDNRDHTSDNQDNRNHNGFNYQVESRDSDSSGSDILPCRGRTRRPRKAVVYKEKPLNRKLRR